MGKVWDLPPAQPTTCTRPGVCAVDHDTCNGYPRIVALNARRLLGENYDLDPERYGRSYESCHTPAGDRCAPDAPESIAVQEREDAGYDAVKARRARQACTYPRCCCGGYADTNCPGYPRKRDASAEAYDAAHAAGREAARNLDRLLAGNNARADFIAQQITDAVLRAVWGRR